MNSKDIKQKKRRKLTNLEFRKHVYYIWNIVCKSLGKKVVGNFESYCKGFENTFTINEDNLMQDTSCVSLLTRQYYAVTNFANLKYDDIDKINYTKLIRTFTLEECRAWIWKHHISPLVYTEGCKQSKWDNLRKLQQEIIDYNDLSEYDEGINHEK